MLSRSLFSLVVLFTLAFFAAEVNAQMFSVSSSAPSSARALQVPSTISPGLTFVDFSYYGPGGEDLPDDLLEFDGTLWGIAYESATLSLFIADRTSLGEDGNIRATRAGIGIRSPAVINSGRNYRISIPFGISTDFTLVRTPETANTNREFAQNSGYLSAGIDGLFRLNENVIFQTVSVPSFGYTVGSFGARGGISYKLRQDFRLNFVNLFDRFGITAGYSLEFTRFNNTDRQFRYDWAAQQIMLGVNF